jgi:colanic acid/amylovoran biosynthesis protein
MLEEIKRQFPSAEIAISSYDPKDRGRYGAYQHYDWLRHIFYQTYRGGEGVVDRLRVCLAFRMFMLSLCLFRTAGLFRNRPYWLFPKGIADKIRSYEQFDLVVACGGGYLLTKGLPRKLERLLGFDDLALVALDFSLARLFNKPYILYNQSIGPFFRKHDTHVAKRHIKNAKAVLCREELTYERLMTLGLRNIALTADIAFLLPSKPSRVWARYQSDNGFTDFGITVRDCLLPNQQREYEEHIARFISGKLASRPELRCFFMPQVVYEDAGDNDLHVSQRIRAQLPGNVKDRAIVISDDLHPSELKHVIGQMDYFVGTRMHSNIFALSSGVKTVAISYEPKTEGIMAMLGLHEYVVQAKEVTVERLELLLSKLIADETYLCRVGRAIESVQQRARYDLRSLL